MMAIVVFHVASLAVAVLVLPPGPPPAANNCSTIVDPPSQCRANADLRGKQYPLINMSRIKH
jgi:hypothetical protein